MSPQSGDLERLQKELYLTQGYLLLVMEMLADGVLAPDDSRFLGREIEALSKMRDGEDASDA